MPYHFQNDRAEIEGRKSEPRMPKLRHRDSETGQYAFDGDYDRLCECGHSLGVHSQGGFYCGTDAIGNNEPEAAGCACERFRPTGKRRTR